MFSSFAFLEKVNLWETIQKIWQSTGFNDPTSNWTQYVMLLISFVLVYLAIVKKYEPLLLLPIAFGVFIANIPGASSVLLSEPAEVDGVYHEGGLLYYLGLGVKYVIYPPLIFLGIGAMTDFGPMIANPKTIILGAAAQIGIFVTFILAYLVGFAGTEAAAIGIIGGADGPTAIYLAARLFPEKMSEIAIAAYSYMALIPIIQPPIMRALTTKKERMIKMEQLRPVSKTEKIIYPLMVTAVVGIILPMSLPLLGMLMLGNLLKESGVVERLVKTSSNELINIVTIFLGVVVGTKAYGPTFLSIDTLKIVVLGLLAFMVATASGVLMAKLMNKITGGKINPLIGSAGVSAVPMAARISQLEGQREDPSNYLLMHAMGPNVAGVIGSAIAAGALLAMFGA